MIFLSGENISEPRHQRRFRSCCKELAMFVAWFWLINTIGGLQEILVIEDTLRYLSVNRSDLRQACYRWLEIGLVQMVSVSYALGS